MHLLRRVSGGDQLQPDLRLFFVRSIGVLVLVLLAVACGRSDTAGVPSAQAEPSPPPSRTEDPRPKIVFLGDSLTAGLGLVETQSYPGLLQDRMDAEGFRFEVVNAGVSGDTSAGGVRRLDWALQEDVKILIVALGANDGLRGLSVNEMKQNLARIIESARAKGVVVILAGMEAPPNYGPEYVASFRQAYRDLALQYKVQFVPFLLDKVAGQPAMNQPDGIHPNAQGAGVVADTVWAVLKPLLDQFSAS
jgi:acyl-CoA thioesterase-1